MGVTFLRSPIEHVLTEDLTGVGADLDLTPIAADYRALRVYVNHNTTHSAATNLRLEFNGDTGANYNWARIWGNTGGVTGQYAVADGNSLVVGGAMGTGNGVRHGITIIEIIDYHNTLHDKVVHAWCMRSDADAGGTQYPLRMAGVWKSTAAVSSIQMFNEAGGTVYNFSADSEAQLFGLR